MSAASRKRPRRKNRAGKNTSIQKTQQLVSEGFTQRIASEQARTFQETLTTSPDLRSLLEHMRQCYEEFDARMAGTPFSPPFACAKGCSHCCYNQVSLTPPEAVYLGVHLLERFSEAEREDIKVRLKTLLERIKDKSIKEIAAIRHELPCVLLQENVCSVHVARPFACRGWNSVDAAQCQRSVQEQNPMVLIENHALPRELAESLQLGLLYGSQGLGMEAGYLLLPRALHLLLKKGPLSCGEVWLQRGGFFAGWKTDAKGC